MIDVIGLTCQDRLAENPPLHTHSNNHSQCNTKSFFRSYILSCYETERGFSEYGQTPLRKKKRWRDWREVYFSVSRDAVRPLAIF